MTISGTIRAAAAALLLTTGLPGPAMAVTVVEFTNVESGRFHLTAFADEIAVLDGGGAGPGWSRTGQAFEVSGAGEPVFRFVGTVDRAQHFFTIDPGEAATLAQPGSGWILEGTAFRAHPHGRPDFFSPTPSGCPTTPSPGGGFFQFRLPTFPVFRLNGNSLGFGHRYTADAGLRATLLARGWVDEGVGFCVAGTYPAGMPLREFRIEAISSDRVGSPAYCRDESRLGSCYAAFNLPLPNQPSDTLGAHRALTGVTFATLAYMPLESLSLVPANSTGPAFILPGSFEQGLYFDSRASGDSPYASLALHHQLKTSRGPLDERFRPWRLPLPDSELVFRFDLAVATLVAEPASHAYGHTTIEFLDQRAARSFYFNVIAYASSPLGGDAVGFDVNENKPIVGSLVRHRLVLWAGRHNALLLDPQGVHLPHRSE